MGKFFTVLTCRQNFRAAACAGKRWKNKALRNLRVPPEFSCHLPPSGAQLSGTDSPIPPAAGAPPSRSKEKSAGGTRINLVVKTHATFAKELHRAKRVAAEWQERLGPEPSPGKEERAGAQTASGASPRRGRRGARGGARGGVRSGAGSPAGPGRVVRLRPNSRNCLDRHGRRECPWVCPGGPWTGLPVPQIG